MSHEAFAFGCFTIELLVFAVMHVGLNKLKDRQQGKREILPHELTVVIPLRNESTNLPELVRSLLSQPQLPKVIFVDDHSEDNSLQFIKHTICDHEAIQVLRLSKGEGKKTALDLGFKQSETKWILTLDADVTLPKGYFVELFQNKWNELNVLPVKMIANSSFWGKFWSQEYTYQKVVNWFVSGWNQPISGSGANLLFVKEFYLESKSERIDFEVASGDDQFLIEFARKQKRQILTSVNGKLAVTTNAESSFITGLNQRLRWIQKMRLNRDKQITFIGMMGLSYQVLTYVGIVLLSFSQPYLGAGLVFLKLTCQNVLTHRVQPNSLKVFDRLLFLIFYPFYMSILLLFMLFYRPKWKGRV